MSVGNDIIRIPSDLLENGDHESTKRILEKFKSIQQLERAELTDDTVLISGRRDRVDAAIKMSQFLINMIRQNQRTKQSSGS